MIGLNSNITHQEFLDALDVLTTADSVKELTEHSRRLTSFKGGSYHHIPSIGSHDYNRLNTYWSTGLPQHAHDYLNEKGGKSCPVMKYVLDKARPFWFSRLVSEKDLSDERSQHRIKLVTENLGDGMLIPLFGPYHRQGYAFILCENPREFYDEIFLWQVQALLQVGHIRYCKLMKSLSFSVKLTNRESEVLELICFGKTNPEIGIILGISTNTVSGYVKSIFIKFNATDRVTVALRAQCFSL